MLGAIECRSPDPLQVIQIRRHEIWNRDLRRVMATLGAEDRALIYAHLHHTRHDWVPDGQGDKKWVELEPDFGVCSGAFKRLWRALARGKFLRPLTPRSRDEEPDVETPAAEPRA